MFPMSDGRGAKLFKAGTLDTERFPVFSCGQVRKAILGRPGGGAGKSLALQSATPTVKPCRAKPIQKDIGQGDAARRGKAAKLALGLLISFSVRRRYHLC